MKVYTANEDAKRIETIRLGGFKVTNKATKVALWFGDFCAGLESGLGFVDVVAGYDRGSENIVMRRLYGPILIRFKEAEK